MTRLLILNPNTSVSTTERLHAAAVATLGSAVEVHSATARFGAPYISCETSYAIAGHATLDSWLRWRNEASAPADTVLVGCFGDPGLFALRELCDVRVTGLAEAAFAEAAARGPFAVVTGGERWQPMLKRLAYSLGHSDLLRQIFTVPATGAQLAADPEFALRTLAQACQQVAHAQNVNSIILGGAGLLGLAEQLTPLVPVPLIDSVLAGLRQALIAPVGMGEIGDGEKAGWVGMA